jgi:hypothetical protein
VPSTGRSFENPLENGVRLIYSLPSVNRTDATAKTRRAVAEVLKRQGYVSAVDVLLHIGMLDKADYENWRMGRVPYLEKVVHGSLGKVTAVPLHHLAQDSMGSRHALLLEGRYRPPEALPNRDERTA